MYVPASDVVVVDFGGAYESGIETFARLDEVNPSSAKDIDVHIPPVSGLHGGFKKGIWFVVSLGYIESIKHIEQHSSSSELN